VWGMESEDDLISDMPLFVLGPKKEVLLSLPRDLDTDKNILSAVSGSSAAGIIEYNFKGDSYLVGYWNFISNITFLLLAGRS